MDYVDPYAETRLQHHVPASDDRTWYVVQLGTLVSILPWFQHPSFEGTEVFHNQKTLHLEYVTAFRRWRLWVMYGHIAILILISNILLGYGDLAFCKQHGIVEIEQQINYSVLTGHDYRAGSVQRGFMIAYRRSKMPLPSPTIKIHTRVHTAQPKLLWMYCGTRRDNYCTA